MINWLALEQVTVLVLILKLTFRVSLKFPNSPEISQFLNLKKNLNFYFPLLWTSTTWTNDRHIASWKFPKNKRELRQFNESWRIKSYADRTSIVFKSTTKFKHYESHYVIRMVILMVIEIGFLFIRCFRMSNLLNCVVTGRDLLENRILLILNLKKSIWTANWK